MVKHKILKIILLFSLIFFTAASSALASNVIFILDGSNSMWGQVDGKAKIETAREVLTSMLKELPKDTNVGFMAYGYRSKEDCKDVEVLSPIGPNDPEKLSGLINAIKPKGMTPLSYSLEQALPSFEKLKGQNNSVVLVSDGKETCGGDPCKTAAKLASAGVNVKVHVVGFDVKKEERSQLECIAREGGGKYFNAESAKGLKDVFAEVKKEVVAPAPPPKPKPQAKEYFRDDFDGSELKPHWKVIKPNPDNYIVENGNLLVVSSTAGALSKDSVENIFSLDKPLPQGDWVMTVKMNVDFQTMQERVFFGLYESKDSFIIIQTIPYRWPGVGNMASFEIEVIKYSKGKSSSFKKIMWNVPPKKNDKRSFAEAAKDFPQPLLFRLSKKGRSYFGAAMLEGAEKKKWVELEKITALRAKGNLVVGVNQGKNVKGETTVNIDWVKIEEVK